MSGLCFRFKELIEELDMLKVIGKKFLQPRYIGALDDLKSDLKSTWSAAKDRPIKLNLPELHTTPSQDYETGNRRGGPAVYAIITGTWKVSPLGDNAKKPKVKARRLLEFSDIASTKIELFDMQDPHTRLAMWRMELGAEDHPGCYFHIQVLGETDEPPFPRTVPIPRFPSMFVTPMGAIEYVLGELFQDKWAKVVAENKHEVQRWRSLQTERLKRLLGLYQKELVNVVSSPWVHLKRVKPDGTMFL